MASQMGYLDVVELLLARDADVNIQNEDGETALHLAAFYGHSEVVQVLLGNDVNLRMVHAQNNEGKTSLDLASNEGHHDIAQLLQSVRGIGLRGGSRAASWRVG